MKSKPQYIYDRSKLPEYLTIVDAANFIGMSEKTITRYCHNGEIMQELAPKRRQTKQSSPRRQTAHTALY